MSEIDEQSAVNTDEPKRSNHDQAPSVPSSSFLNHQSMIMTSSMLSTMSLSGHSDQRLSQPDISMMIPCQKLEKLRIIKPFDEKQLLEFYDNHLLECNQKFIDDFNENYFQHSLIGLNINNKYYEEIILKLDKSIERFMDINRDLNANLAQIKSNENDQCWRCEMNEMKQSEYCGDGQLLEHRHSYRRCYLNETFIDNQLKKSYYSLREKIMNKHIVHSFNEKNYRFKFELIIHETNNIIKYLEHKLDYYDFTNQQQQQQQPQPNTRIDSNDDQTTIYGSSIFDDPDESIINNGSCNDNDLITKIYRCDQFNRILYQQIIDLITSLFAYYRYKSIIITDNTNSAENLKHKCYEAIISVSTKFLAKLATFNDRLFLLNHILRLPAGTSKQFSQLLQPLDPLILKKQRQFDLGKKYVDYTVTVIATILTPIKSIEKNSYHQDSKQESNQSQQESLWLMIDNELDDEELMLDQESQPSSIAELTENDIITYLACVPYREILQFMSLINDNHNESDDSEIIHSSIETSMIRLFAFSTRLINIFRNGLKNFNCLRHKRLTLYLASMIKQLIKTISDNWRWCKQNITINDTALLLRLQVEFDHFMLRSIMAILSTQRRGVWPLLAKIDFDGISEPMLWNILWVVYQNGHHMNNEQMTIKADLSLSGLCPYMSSNYWKDKFQNFSRWKFVFIEKLSILSLEEASGLIDFFFNMAISRSKCETSVQNQQQPHRMINESLIIDESVDDFLREIIERLIEICLFKKLYTKQQQQPSSNDSINQNNNQKYLQLSNQEFYSTKGVACLIKLLSKYKSMLFILLQFIQTSANDNDDQDDNLNLLTEPCLNLFTSIVIDDWRPELKLFQLLYKWLIEKPYYHLYNRFARILLTKIGWNRILMHNDSNPTSSSANNDQSISYLMIPIQQQQQFVIKLYQSIARQLKLHDNQDSKSDNSNNRNNDVNNIKYPYLKYEHFDSDDKRLQLAQSIEFNDYCLWCWSQLLSLRIHIFDVIPDDHCWDDIVFNNNDNNNRFYISSLKYRQQFSNQQQQHWTLKCMLKYNYDSEMIEIVRGIEKNDPYAIYIGIMCSDLLFKTISNNHINIDLKRMIELLNVLLRNNHLIAILQILYHYLPFCFEFNEGELRSNQSFIEILLTLLQNNDLNGQLLSIILLQLKHFSNKNNSALVLQSWTECLFETINSCFNMKIISSSWSLSSILPQFLHTSSTGSSSSSMMTTSTKQIDIILKTITIIFDSIAMELLVDNDNYDCLKLYQKYLCRKLYGRMMNWKLSQLDTIMNINSPTPSSSNNDKNNVNWFSSYWYESNEKNSPKYLSDNDGDSRSQNNKSILRSPWMTPFHLLLRYYLNSKHLFEYQPIYLIFLLTEIDIRRTFNIWNYLIIELRKKQLNKPIIIINNDKSDDQQQSYSNQSQQIDYELIESELKQACMLYEKAPIPYQLLPINLLTCYLLRLIRMNYNDIDINRSIHPLIPLLWRQFFSQYFLLTDTLSTIGNRFVEQPLLKQLNECLNLLFDYHNKRWIYLNDHSHNGASNNKLSPPQQQNSEKISLILLEDRLCKLYRAYRLWFKDNRFIQHADLDDEQFINRPEYQIKLLNSIVSLSSVASNNEIIVEKNYINENFWYEIDHLNSYYMLNYVNRPALLAIIVANQNSWLNLIKPSMEPLRNADVNHSSDEGDLKDDDDNDEEYILSKMQLSDSSSNEIQYINQINSTKNVEYKLNERFVHIVNHFKKLTESLNCQNILFFDDHTANNIDNSNNTAPHSQPQHQDISLIFMIIHQIVDNIVEEATFIEKQLEKYKKLNEEYTNELIRNLYSDVDQELIEKIPCDRSEFDSNGCQSCAIIKFKFVESKLNTFYEQKCRNNRLEFEHIVQSLLNDIPGDKMIASLYFLRKIIDYLLNFYLIDSNNCNVDDHVDNCQKKSSNIERLFETMNSWINSINLIGINYYLTGQLLDIFLQMLQSLSKYHLDDINYFYLNTALQRSISIQLIQQLSPCLQPSATSSQMFIKMYKLIAMRLNQQQSNEMNYQISSQTLFVLLSKFDIQKWLISSQTTDEQRLNFLNCLFDCFQYFNVNPSDDYLVIYDLYRKHLQDLILYRFPTYMPDILIRMLNGMNQQCLAPTLWNSILHTFGFYTKSLSSFSSASLNDAKNQKCLMNEKQLSLIEFDYQTFDNDIRSFLMRHKLFTSHELYNLLQLIIEFNYDLLKQFEHSNNEQQSFEYLDHFKIYNQKYLQFLTFISYCWFNSNRYDNLMPDDLSIIWSPFFDNWKLWIFPRNSTRFIQWEHLCFTWQLYVNTVQFMLDLYYDDQTKILSFLWQTFLTFILETKSIHSNDCEMFETKLLQIKNWSKFRPTIIDMKLMYESIVMENYSIERLNSYIISKIEWNQVLLSSDSSLSIDQSIEILENLIYTIISLIEQPYIYDVNFLSIPFILLPNDKIQKIIITLLEVMRKRITTDIIDKYYDNKSIADNRHRNQLSVILQLSKSLVQLNSVDLIINSNNTNQITQNEPLNNDNQELNDQQQIKLQQDRNAEKIIYYIECIGLFIAHLLNENSDYFSKNSDILLKLLKDTIELPLIRTKFLEKCFDSSNRLKIFNILFQSTINECTSANNLVICELLSRQLMKIFSSITSYELFGELIISIGKTINSMRISINFLEYFIENYFNLSGNLQYLVDNLDIIHLNSHNINRISSNVQLNENIITEPDNDNHNNKTSSTTTNGQNLDDFLLETIRTRSCLLLLIYINRRLKHRNVPDICTRRYIYTILMQCLHCFKFTSNDSNTNLKQQSLHLTDLKDESKQCFFWTKLFDLLTFDHSTLNDGYLNISIHHLSSLKTNLNLSNSTNSNDSDNNLIIDENLAPSSSSKSILLFKEKYLMNPYLLSLDMHQEEVQQAINTLLSFCRQLNQSLADSLNRSIFNLFRQHRTPSPKYLFIIQSLVSHGLCTMIETFFPEFEFDQDIHSKFNETDKLELNHSATNDTIRQRFLTDLKELLHQSYQRLRNWRKQKSFQELWPYIDGILELTKALKIPIKLQNYQPLKSNNSVNDFKFDFSTQSQQQQIINENDVPKFLINDYYLDDDYYDDTIADPLLSPLIDYKQITNSISLPNDSDNANNDGDDPIIKQQSLSLTNNQIELLTKQWLRYYIQLSHYQQKRFHFIQNLLLEFYYDFKYMRHF